MEIEIHNLLIKCNKSISFAESITGGAMAYRMVKNPGCSAYFLGSLVTYSRGAKQELLSVSAKTIDMFGEVSCEVAAEMSLGALQTFHSDFAVAITGIAGPTGETATKPLGMVCFALSSKEKETISWTDFFQGERLFVIDRAVEAALKQLYDYIS